jgi:hypothetical protein
VDLLSKFCNYAQLKEATGKLAQPNNSKIFVIGSEKGGMPILIQ